MSKTTSLKLSFILKTSGFTQEVLARRLGVSFVTLNSWLHHDVVPRKKAQERIDALHRSLSVQEIVPASVLEQKKQLIQEKKTAKKSPLKIIISRKNLFEQFILSLTYHTNSIEGSTLTEKETAEVLFENASLPRKTLIEQLEAKNHQVALKYLFEAISQTKNFSITEELILKLHSILMNGILDDAGRYRLHGVRILGSRVPTANYPSIPSKIKAFIGRVNSKSTDIVFHLAKTHAEFEQIHPFSDGNGRMGRLILCAQSLSRNLPPVLIENSRKRLYLAYLEKAQLQEKFELLEDFFCDALLESYRLLEEA